MGAFLSHGRTAGPLASRRAIVCADCYSAGGALIGDAETLDAALSACKDGAAVLTALEERLNAEKPTYGRSSLAGPRVSPMPKVHSP